MNTFTNGLQITDGSLIVDNNNAIGSGTLVIGDATTANTVPITLLSGTAPRTLNNQLVLNRDLTFGGNQAANTTVSSTTAASNATVTVASSAGLSVGELVTGTGITAGTSILSIVDATHSQLSANATAAGTVNLVYSSGTNPAGVSLNSLTLNGTINLGAVTRTLTVTNPLVTATLNGVLSGAGLTKTGDGTLLLAPQSTGAITLPGAAATTTAGSATLTLAAANTNLVNGMLVQGPGIAQGTTITNIVGAVITLSAPALTTTSNSTVAFGSPQVYSPTVGAAGDTSLTLTPAQVANSLVVVGASVTGAGVVAGTTISAINTTTGVVSLSNALLAGVVGQNLTFGGATAVTTWNTYAGATTVNGGLLKLGAVGALPASTALVVAATGVVDMAGYSDTIGSLAGDTLTTGGLLTNSSASPLTLTFGGDNTNTTFSGSIAQGTSTGAVSLVKNGTGTTALNGFNTYSGTTTINAGVLAVNTVGDGGPS